MILPFHRIMEEFRAMDIADDMIYILLIYNDFRVTAFYEFLTQFLQRRILLYSLDFCTWNHTVTYFGIAEVERILKDLDFIIDFILIGSIINARLNQIIKIHLRKALIPRFYIHLHAHKTKQNPTQEGTELAYRPQNHIADIGNGTEDGKQTVRVSLEKSLRQELTSKQDYQGRKNGISRHSKGRIHPTEDRIIKQSGYQDTIHNECDVIAHKHRTDEAVRMVIE